MKRKVDYALSQKAVVHRDDNADEVQARIYAVEKDVEGVLQKNFQRVEINLTSRK